MSSSYFRAEVMQPQVCEGPERPGGKYLVPLFFFEDNRCMLSLQTGSVKERLVQLQRCMHSPQEPGGTRGPAGQDSSSLGAILALMAAVLTECDLHCHSQALGAMAKRLGEWCLVIIASLRPPPHTHTHRKSAVTPLYTVNRTSMSPAERRS